MCLLPIGDDGDFVIADLVAVPAGSLLAGQEARLLAPRDSAASGVSAVATVALCEDGAASEHGHIAFSQCRGPRLGCFSSRPR